MAKTPALRSLPRVLAVLFVAVALSRATAQAPPPSPPLEAQIAEAEKGVAEQRASLHEHPERAEAWPGLMMAEVILERLRIQAENPAGAVDENVAATRSKAAVERVIAEWKRASPDDAAPYLVEMQSQVAPEQQDDYVLSLAERFPNDARALGRAIQILARREQSSRSAEMIESALAHNPERSNLWPLAIRFYESQGNTARQRELTNAWFENFPGDPAALQFWLSSVPGNENLALTHERAERFVARPIDAATAAARVEACSWMLQWKSGELRDLGLGCLADAAVHAKEASVRERAAAHSARALVAAGDLQGFSRALSRLSADLRLETVTGAADSLAENDCAGRLAVLGLAPEVSVSRSAFALRSCTSYEPARARYLEAFAQSPADELTSLFSAWFTNVNGRFLEDFGLAPRIVEILEGRYRQDPSLFSLLDSAYQLARWDDRRAAHLERGLLAASRSSDGVRSLNSQQVLWLARYQARPEDDARANRGRAGFEKSIKTLEAGLDLLSDPAIGIALGEALALANRPADLERLAQKLEGKAGDRGSAERELAALAPLLRARALFATPGDRSVLVARALGLYRQFFELSSFPRRDAAVEAVGLALAASSAKGSAPKGSAALEYANELCAKDSVREGLETPAQCAANLLALQGEGEGALTALEAAVARAPDNLTLLASLAAAAERAEDFERAERAYRDLVARDSASEAGWSGLGRLAEQRGDLARLETLARDAEGASGSLPPQLALSLARTATAQGHNDRALEVLQALRARFPDINFGVDELRAAYAAAARTPAPSAPNLPRADLSRWPSAAERDRYVAAMHEIDAFRFGLRAPINDALVLSQVEREAVDNPYAAVLLGIFHHGGWFGLAVDERRAVESVVLHLSGLRAAAESGDGYAEYLWGTLLVRGLAVPKQGEEGSAFLRRAAEKGEIGASYNLGYLSEAGDLVARDPQEAARWYLQAAEAGHLGSMSRLAYLWLDGPPELRDVARGEAWLEKAANRGDRGAISWWAARLLYGVPGTAPRPAQARPWLEKAAATGEPRGRSELAHALLVGLGGPPDEKRAVELWRGLARDGNAAAAVQLGFQSVLGRGLPRDMRAAADWFERAAALGLDGFSSLIGVSDQYPPASREYFRRGLDQLTLLAERGDPYSLGLLARLYYGGQGVELDEARGVALARRAFETRGNATLLGEAARVLGNATGNGNGGVAIDTRASDDWYRKGAEGGNSFCMMFLAQSLLRGSSGAQDISQGIAWLEKSGERGNFWAIKDLGQLYANGWNGVAVDEAKATIWMQKAAQLGDAEAIGWLKVRGIGVAESRNGK